MAEPAVPARVQETDFTADRVAAAHNSNADLAPSDSREYGSVTAVAPEPEPETAPSAAVEGPSYTRTARLLAPDLLRGLLMVLQSLDHASVGSGAWRHGQALETEAATAVVTKWNDTVPWIARTLTHLCAPGFMFLLGFGVVMFGRSRVKLGWSAGALAWHFFIRGLVLFMLSEILGIILSGFRIWFFNIVLMSLGIDFFLAGLLWMAINASESTLTTALESWLGDSKGVSDEQQPLLGEQTSEQTSRKESRASSISFHLHNALLAGLTFVTIAWNIWMSPTHGYCHVADKVKALADDYPPYHSPSGLGPAWDFLWYAVNDPRDAIMSGFPPLAWLSFAILGILYARVYLSRAWTMSAVNAGNALAGVFFALIFVATRLLHIGNLSEGCLQMKEHLANPDMSQYLTSFKAFFYLVKYPPDVAFFAATLSVNFLLLAFFGAIPARIASRIPTLLVFGKCALFFYVVHFIVYTTLGTIAKALFGHKMGFPDIVRGGEAIGIGNGPVFWIMWLIGLGIMYPSCYYYGRFKATKDGNSLWRFF